MKSVNLKIDPETRDDIYADEAHVYFLDFLFLEAVGVVVKDFMGDQDKVLEAISDPNYYINDPECEISSSIEYLLDVLKEYDRADGVDVNSDTYSLNEFHGMVSDKLSLAISSITVANTAGELMAIYNVLQDPIYTQGMTVKGTHLDNLICLFIAPKEQFQLPAA